MVTPPGRWLLEQTQEGAWGSERGDTTRRSVKEIYGRKMGDRGNEGRSCFSVEGEDSLRQQRGTTHGLVIVKSYQLTMGHQGIRG